MELGGSRADRRKRWCSFSRVIGCSVGTSEDLVGGRSVETDHVGSLRRASTSILEHGGVVD